MSTKKYLIVSRLTCEWHVIPKSWDHPYSLWSIQPIKHRRFEFSQNIAETFPVFFLIAVRYVQHKHWCLAPCNTLIWTTWNFFIYKRNLSLSMYAKQFGYQNQIKLFFFFNIFHFQIFEAIIESDLRKDCHLFLFFQFKIIVCIKDIFIICWWNG